MSMRTAIHVRQENSVKKLQLRLKWLLMIVFKASTVPVELSILLTVLLGIMESSPMLYPLEMDARSVHLAVIA
jgi:hypothetical protein